MRIVIVNPKLPLYSQVPAGLILQFKGTRAIAATFVLRGWSTRFQVVRGSQPCA